MEALEIRDRRYRLQKQIRSLEEGDAEGQRLEQEVKQLQAMCPHEHVEEAPDQGLWRCRDCDLQGELDSAPGEEQPASEGEGDDKG